MSEIIFVTPKEGMTVLHPDFPHGQIPESGKRVVKSAYWKRMEKQGAVTISEPPEEKAPIPEKKVEVKDGKL